MLLSSFERLFWLSSTLYFDLMTIFSISAVNHFQVDYPNSYFDDTLSAVSAFLVE